MSPKSLSPVTAVQFVALLVLVGGAVIWDLRTRRVPNMLTLPVALLGVGLAFVEGGFPGAGWALLGSLIASAVFLPLVVRGYVGGGDMKLLAAVGALLGPLGAVRAMLFGSVLGGFWALAWLALRRGQRALPYAPPLAVGALVAFFL